MRKLWEAVAKRGEKVVEGVGSGASGTRGEGATGTRSRGLSGSGTRIGGLGTKEESVSDKEADEDEDWIGTGKYANVNGRGGSGGSGAKGREYNAGLERARFKEFEYGTHSESFSFS
jgi:hypothetical protein